MFYSKTYKIFSFKTGDRCNTPLRDFLLLMGFPFRISKNNISHIEKVAEFVKIRWGAQSIIDLEATLTINHNNEYFEVAYRYLSFIARENTSFIRLSIDEAQRLALEIINRGYFDASIGMFALRPIEHHGYTFLYNPRDMSIYVDVDVDISSARDVFSKLEGLRRAVESLILS